MRHNVEIRNLGRYSLVDRFLEISGYAYHEVKQGEGLYSVLMRMHKLQLELRWFVASNGRPMVGLWRGELWLGALVLPPSVVVTT